MGLSGKILFAVLIIAVVLLTAIFFVLLNTNKGNPPLVIKNPKLSNPPEIIKAVYVTGSSVVRKKYLDYLDYLFENTEINAVVVDVKGSGGTVTNIKDLAKFFHERGIYLIGRIVVFADPVYSKIRPDLAVYNEAKSSDLNKVLWQDYGGMFWLDPASKDVWDYNISLAKDAFYHGFDEINFDYVRFPSDGNLEIAGFPVWDGKTLAPIVIKKFFEYTRAQLLGEKISIDLFGQTTILTDDMGIGQIIEDAFLYFDYISPMIYPSHYIDGFLGFENPAEHPYDIVKYSMDSAIARQKKAEINVKFRPWLQDFNMGAIYTADMVRAEIQAVKDALGPNYRGFMLWNANNIYTEEAAR